MRENDGGVNVINIYCKHICKYHNVSLLQLLYINKFKNSNFQKKEIKIHLSPLL
jgi:hypothetical protein